MSQALKERRSCDRFDVRRNLTAAGRE
jgi:hypothetical protein